jgi:hypothetical protein
MQQFHYDGQIRRFLAQFIRMMSNFQVEFGKDRNGQVILQRVPVYYGDGSRQAQMILRNNSESTLNAVPAMAVYINGLTYDQSRMQEPYHVSKINLRQRSYDPETGEYGTTQDTAYTIERLMPVPYKLTLKLDIWTSNTEQKLQLLEQINVLFNPSLEIQSTDNYIDWTSLTTVRKTDDTWTSRSVPMGTDEPIDISSMTFEIPIWISAPAKVKQLGVVQKIIASVFDANGEINEDSLLENNLLARKMLTPMGYGVLFVGNTLKLVKSSELPTSNGTDKIGTADNWHDLVDVYGQLREGTTQVRLELEQTFDETTGTTRRVEIIGTVAFHPSDSTILLFTVDGDTLPTNTLAPVDAIIDPTSVAPGNSILTPSSGTRYLILESIPLDSTSSITWGGLVANANDIIEYDGANWAVSFDSESTNTLEYVTNLTTTTQYKWLDGNWSKAVEGIYREGAWSLIL